MLHEPVVYACVVWEDSLKLVHTRPTAWSFLLPPCGMTSRRLGGTGRETLNNFYEWKPKSARAVIHGLEAIKWSHSWLWDGCAGGALHPTFPTGATGVGRGRVLAHGDRCLETHT